MTFAPKAATGTPKKRRFANIITYLKHRITNATCESLNAKIQWVKYTARGFRNNRTSSTRSTSTAAAWISPRQPLNSRKRQKSWRKTGIEWPPRQSLRACRLVRMF
jgi:hypothetical protein